MLRKPGSHGCSSKYCADDQISGCLETAWSSFDIRRSPPILSDKMFEGVSLCHIAENIVRERFKNLQAELSEWTEFPVTGLAFGRFSYPSRTQSLNDLTPFEMSRGFQE